jgi:hypothetical protein
MQQETFPSWNTSGRPKKAKQGTFGFNFQTNKLEYWNGSKWLIISMTPIKIPKDVIPSDAIPQGRG